MLMYTPNSSEKVYYFFALFIAKNEKVHLNVYCCYKYQFVQRLYRVKLSVHLAEAVMVMLYFSRFTKHKALLYK